MLKGLLSGGFWGLVVGGASLTVASLVTEQPAGNTPPMPPQVNAPQSAQAPADSTQPAGAVADDTAVTAAQAPRAVAPQMEITQPMADIEPLEVPQTGGVVDDLVAPAPVVAAPEIEAVNEQPVLPNPQSVAPQIPAVEQDLTVSTTPAPVPDPVVVEDDLPAAAPMVDLAVPMPLPVVPQVVVPEEIAIAVPDLVAPEVTSNMPTGDASVKVNRIVTQPVPALEDEVADAAQEVDETAPALVKFGTKFENVDGKPLLSVILIDDGSMGGAVPALTALPFPVTVILDPSAADAASKMAEYRGAGIEVGVLAALPNGATPSNVEVAFEATFKALPDTVLMLDAGDGGLQNDRAVTDQAMTLLATQGRGFITVAKLEDLAAQTDMELGSITWTTETQDDIAAYEEFRAAAGEATQAAFPTLMELADGGLFALRLDSVTAPAVQPLNDVRDAVSAGWRAQNQQTALLAQANETAKTILPLTGFDTLGLTANTDLATTRRSFIAGTPPSFISDIFELQTGDVAVIDNGNNAIIVRLDSIAAPDASDPQTGAQKQAAAEQAAAGISQDIFEAFATSVQNRTDVVLDQAAVNAVNAQLQ